MKSEFRRSIPLPSYTVQPCSKSKAHLTTPADHRHPPTTMPTQPTDDPARRTTEARAAVTASLAALGSAHNTELRSRATDLHANFSAIAKQETELAKQTATLTKQSAQWRSLADTGTKRLNEVGDVQNWAEIIERDLLVVEETLRLVEGRAEVGNASGTTG